MSEHRISRRTFTKAGFTYHVDRIHDAMPDLSPLCDPARYQGCTKAERMQYARQDRARLEAYRRDEWYYIGIAVEIRKQTASNWADGGLEVGRASVWGIESDSDEAFLMSVEQEEIAEAEAELERLRTALGEETVSA